MVKLREAGRLLTATGRKRFIGTLSTKRFQGGDTWYKVLEFQETSSSPGQHQLYDARVKECDAEKSVMVLSGLVQEDGAWVVQEWEVDVAPQRAPDPFDSAWVKPLRRHTTAT